MTHTTHGPLAGRRLGAETPFPHRPVRYPGAEKPDREPDWRDRAVCANAPDGDLWFPQGTVGPWLVQIEEAKAACRNCPVIERCAELLVHMESTLGGEVAGIWAATSEEDRNGDRRHRKRQADRKRHIERKRAST